MAAAYAVVVSVTQIIDQVNTYHTRQPVFVDEQQMLINDLRGKVSCLKEFLEKYSSVAESVSSEIVDALHAAEDILESHIIDDIHSRSSIEATLAHFEDDEGQRIHLFSEQLEKVIVDMVTIEEEIGKIKKKEPDGGFFMKLIHMTVFERGEQKAKMAVAYAAVVSLTQIIYHVQAYHTRQPIFVDEQQTQIEIINDKVTCMQEFLVKYSHLLESVPNGIVDVAHTAENILESYIFERATRAQYEVDKNQRIHVFCDRLGKVMTRMVMIEGKIGDIKKNKLDNLQPQYMQFRDPAHVGLFTSAAIEKEVVGFDDYMKRIMATIVVHEPYLVISIVGMGGIGKTTLAKQVYSHKSIQSSFKYRGWITLSQKFDLRETLLSLLHQFKVHIPENDVHDDELGGTLYKHLSRVRFLIVLDDLWTTDAFEKLMFYIKGTNGSRVLVTTRLKRVATDICSNDICSQEIDVLNERKSWELLRGKVFCGKECPTELVDLGKEIAKNCKGLPLSLVVIAGHLANSNKTQEVWKRVAEQTGSFVSLEDNERCRKTLFLSYTQLPIHLKPCFLYMGIFPEDHRIRVSQLVRLWVAEGFLKAENNKTLEEVALDYLIDLIHRNLVFARSLGDTGNIKYCQIHDVVRDICLTEGVKERFFCNIVSDPEILPDIGSQRRIVIHDRLEEGDEVSESSLQLALFARTVSYNFKWNSSSPLPFKLMRVWNIMDESYPPDNIFQLTNLRYLFADYLYNINLFDSIGMLWNLQTLIAKVDPTREKICLPPVIWKLQHLRHMMLKGIEFPSLPDDTCSVHDDTIVLGNLQTLCCSEGFICTEEALRRIPNVKTLKIGPIKDEGLEFYYLRNLCHFEKILSLRLTFDRNHKWPRDFLQHIEFPRSLKKLIFHGCPIEWEDMSTKIGCLPDLEKLNIIASVKGVEWKPVEGDFPSLKYLRICSCTELVYWKANKCHFPKLIQLHLFEMMDFDKIPSGIGDIQTLQRISLYHCSLPCNDSVMTILNQRKRNLGKEDLEVTVDGERIVSNDGDGDIVSSGCGGNDDGDDEIVVKMMLTMMGRIKRGEMMRKLRRIDEREDEDDDDEEEDDDDGVDRMERRRRMMMMRMLRSFEDDNDKDVDDDGDDSCSDDDYSGIHVTV